MIVRCILPDYAIDGTRPKVLEGDFTEDQITEANSAQYNVFYLPNTLSDYDGKTVIDGTHINVFQYVFVDLDMKHAVYPSKDAFLEALVAFSLPPTKIVDSGNGVHAYWRIKDLEAMSFLLLQRRLCRHFNTDEAVSKIFQLMRLPGTVNTKDAENPKLCELLYEESNSIYTCEQLDTALPKVTHQDEAYCQAHYNKTYDTKGRNTKVDETLPLKFVKLIRNNSEAKDLWAGNTDDRSKADWRLAHIMYAHAFSKDDARSVLVNSSKAITRAPVHRIGYADGIIDKIWAFELEGDTGSLSSSVKSILQRAGSEIKGTRFPCWSYIDATDKGFRLGQVIGLVAGVGVGKTSMALNMFMGFVKNNPNYHHFFVSLEQPENEIAERWQIMCGDNQALYDKVHVIGNYDLEGKYRHLSLEDIKKDLQAFQKRTGFQVGCTVIDHIGVLRKGTTKNGENQAITDICHSMKSFALEINTLLVMQSQAPREKAGIGDLELNKDAAYGTVFFESYLDYMVSIWQPLKRVAVEDSCPLVTAFKFCKIRHKNARKDNIKEDVCYRLIYEPENQHMRELTQQEEQSFDFYAKKALNLRKLDRKTDLVPYKSINWTAKNESSNAGKQGYTSAD